MGQMTRTVQQESDYQYTERKTQCHENRLRSNEPFQIVRFNKIKRLK